MKDILNILFKKDKGEESTKKNEEDVKENADFETAIAATGFGKFNALLFLVTIPTCWASVVETTIMSFVFPAAQCDLNLSLEDKGMLNAITYAGTISSAFLWGFLYDTFGRRKLLLIGFLLDGLFAVLSGFSQNLTFLMVTKFIGGFINTGPFAALTSYLSELHVAKYRTRIPLVMGLLYALGGIYLPFLAHFVLPLNFKFIFGENLVLHSWGLYLLINSLPALLGGVAFFFLPESPKFLMSMGKNDEAMKVFRRIYRINSGKSEETYPIKSLLQENTQNLQNIQNGEVTTSKNSFKDGWTQIRPLFCSPLLKICILVCCLQMFVTMSFNTLRLWLPQIFQAFNDYKFLNNGTSSNLCEMLSVLQPKKEHNATDCFVNFDNFEVYRNSMTVCLTSVIAYLIAGTLINVLGQNKLLAISSFVSGCFAMAIYFAPNSLLSTIFICVFYSFTSLSTNVVLIAIVNLFPTTLRTTTVSLSLMCARSASMLGNIIFPYLLEMGCAPPFFAIASLGFACSIVTFLLPQRNKDFK